YIARGGYSGLARCLRELSQDNVIDIVKKAGLRGCGGAAFPAGQKWEFCRRSPGQEKYLLCNADEGNPGTFKDRIIMEGDPHRLVEGMLIAGYAIGAPYGYIYLRDEYPLAYHRLQRAIAQAEERGLLGDKVLGSNFNFRLRIAQGAGAYVCGEEMALIASVEGRRGMPRSRPPFPAQAGAWDKPTNVNNVETLANVPAILEKGWEWYNGIGTDKSKGTRIVSLSGRVKRSGVVEVPFGPTLRSLIFDVAGMAEGSTFKAVQVGGPAGDCLPPEKLDTPLDFDALTQAGAALGSSSLVVIDQRTCMVDLARFLMGFMKVESCGKCVPCRIGTQRMHQLLDGIVHGKGEISDLDLIPELSDTMRVGSLCGHGQVAFNPALTTLRYFRKEYEAHIQNRECPTGVCKTLVS
ncbi:MAG: NADH-quinone oxidoreductase subunit F, partial [Chloroflexota bacterium]|nr:NADH-quinone oxidoreductase subunit F [Chloroflexota bacterium]